VSLQVLVAGEAAGWGGGMASGSGRAATLSFVAKFFFKKRYRNRQHK